MKALFVCTHNAGRCALAAALARADGRVVASSAGSHPQTKRARSRSQASPRSASTTRITSPVP